MLNDDELKYKKTIDALKKLQRIDAPKDFETTLMRKINQSVPEKDDGFFKRLFMPSRLVPSMALVATAIVLFFVIDLSPEELENPFLLEPRLREDVVMVSSEMLGEEKPEQLPEVKKELPLKRDRVEQNTVASGKDMPKEEMIIRSEETAVILLDSVSDESTLGASLPAPTIISEQPAKVTTQTEIDKSGLDYRQNSLNVEDREKVQDLKEKMQNSVRKRIK